MIRNIFVKNFVLIDELSLDFNASFSSFTGETGAGKSLFIDALSILCGARSSTAFIQHGCDKALVEASFILTKEHPSRLLLEEGGYTLEEDILIVSKEFARDGKSIARINQRQTSASFLKKIMRGIVDIHSQHDSQYLLNVKSHLQLLDEYLCKPTLLQEIKQRYNEYKAKEKKLQKTLQEEFNQDDLDYYEFQLQEIEQLHLQECEIENLEKKQKEMKSFAKLSNKLQEITYLFQQVQQEKLFEISKQLEDIDISELQKVKTEILNAYYAIDEQKDNCMSFVDGFEYDEQAYNEIQSRIYEIQKVIRKHGNTFDDMIEKQKELQQKIHAIHNREAFIQNAQTEIEHARKMYYEKAQVLSSLRKQAALSLAEAIEKELVDLYLQDVCFSVRFEEAENADGIDKIEFYIAMNKGDVMRPLTKVISGGELSRLMLGLKTIFHKLQNIQLLVFDEIDSGVSGKVAYAIGKKMHKIANNNQVFAITHLASVAAWGDYQYVVEKNVIHDHTMTHIKVLNEDERICELAKISSNSTSEQALIAAKELLYSCRQ
ncbi:MAG: DNA repair protein RecN [Breznakia sp.]